MIFRLHTVYNKHDMIKIGSQNRVKSQVLLQVLEKFCCRLYVSEYRDKRHNKLGFQFSLRFNYLNTLSFVGFNGGGREDKGVSTFPLRSLHRIRSSEFNPRALPYQIPSSEFDSICDPWSICVIKLCLSDGVSRILLVAKKIGCLYYCAMEQVR